MIDETTNAAPGPEANEPRVGFCQDCGRPLTRDTVRVVGSGMFCEPCLELRLAAAAAATPGTVGTSAEAGVPYGTVPPSAYPPGTGPVRPGAGAAGSTPPGTMPPLGGDNPSPGLAFLLGLIPGVGAMYNGQFAKGIAHIVIYFLLESMHHVSGLFGFLAFLWCLYQAFEAYHTARARREGRPLPDAFGLNDIGERVGLSPNFGPHAWSRTPGTNGRSAATSWTSSSAAGSASAPNGTPAYPVSEPQVVPPPPQDWTSVPVTPAAAYPPASPYAAVGVPVAPIAYDAAWQASPGAYPAAPLAPAAPATALSRFPAVAVWLIGLGIVFLLLTMDPDRWRVTHLAPFFLGALAVWLFLRRMSASGGVAPANGEGTAYAARFVFALRLPLFLLTLAVITAIESFGHLGFQELWPTLLIVVGGQLIAERVLSRNAFDATVSPADTASFSTRKDGK